MQLLLLCEFFFPFCEGFFGISKYIQKTCQKSPCDKRTVAGLVASKVVQLQTKC